MKKFLFKRTVEGGNKFTMVMNQAECLNINKQTYIGWQPDMLTDKKFFWLIKMTPGKNK